MKNAKDLQGRFFNRTLFVLVLFIGTFCDMLNQTVLAVAQPTLMSTLKVSTTSIQWLTTGFMLVSGIMIPITGWLSNRFNSKWLFEISQVLFLIGTLMSFMATNFQTILVGRLIQAVGSGIASPLIMTMIFAVYPPAKRGAIMGMLGIVFGLAPAIGPTFAGWMVDSFNWRYIFGVILPITAIVIIAGLFLVKDVVPKHNTKLDWLSVAASTIGLGTLLYGLSEAGSAGWLDSTVLLSLAIGVVVTAWFIVRQLRSADPVLNLRSFGYRNFTIGTALGSLSMMAMIGFEIVFPLYLQIVLGLSAIQSGLALLAGAIVTAVTSPIAGAALDKFGAKYLSILGMLILTLGTVPFAFVTANTSLVYLIVLYAVRCFGISMVMMPSSTEALNALPAEQVAHGSAANNVSRQVAGSIGTAVLVSAFSSVTASLSPAKSVLQMTPMLYKTKMFDALLSGYHIAFWIAAGFSLLGFILAWSFKTPKNNEVPVTTETMTQVKVGAAE